MPLSKAASNKDARKGRSFLSDVYAQMVWTYQKGEYISYCSYYDHEREVIKIDDVTFNRQLRYITDVYL